MDSPLSHNTDGLLHNVSWQKHEAGWWEERKVSNVTCLETFGSPQNMPRCAGEKQHASFYTPQSWQTDAYMKTEGAPNKQTVKASSHSTQYHLFILLLCGKAQKGSNDNMIKTYLQTKVASNSLSVHFQFTFCVAFACPPSACVGVLLLDLSRDFSIEEAALRTLKELHLCPCLSQILAAIYAAKALSSLEVMQWKLNLLESVQKRALRMITRSSVALLQLLSLQRREQAAIQLLKDMIHT